MLLRAGLSSAAGELPGLRGEKVLGEIAFCVTKDIWLNLEPLVIGSFYKLLYIVFLYPY
jgi:hypothetical protein